MRIGLVTRADIASLDRAQRLGFRAIEWVRFESSPAGAADRDWRGPAEEIAAAAQTRGLRLSALIAYYRNPLDPKQTESARILIRHALEVAAFLHIPTVTAFAGGVVQTVINERGGNPVYRPLEEFLPQVLAFWEPLAQAAGDLGVRIAFENCPQGNIHLPVMGYNLMARPAIWERFFAATRYENLGLEWDPSHLICQFIDPVSNLRTFGARVFHVHAKDAYVDRQLLARFGICHPGVTEHRMVGFGQADWPQIVHELVRAGYDSDLSVEGCQDPIFQDHPADRPEDPLAGQQLEEAGLLVARRTLEPLVAGMPDDQ